MLRHAAMWPFPYASPGCEHGLLPRWGDLCGLPLGAQGGVWIQDDDDISTHPEMANYLRERASRPILWVIEHDGPLEVALLEEQRFALPGDFDTRPWAMPLQEREQMTVLLAQSGLTSHVLQGIVFEYAGLQVLRRDLSPVAGGAANESDFSDLSDLSDSQ